MVALEVRQQVWALFFWVCTSLLFILQGFRRISWSQISFLGSSCHLEVFSRNPKSLFTEKLHGCLLLIRVTGFQSTRPTDLVVEITARKLPDTLTQDPEVSLIKVWAKMDGGKEKGCHGEGCRGVSQTAWRQPCRNIWLIHDSIFHPGPAGAQEECRWDAEGARAQN